MRYIIANWKMNMNLATIETWLQNYVTNANTNKTVVIAPSFEYLGVLNKVAKQHGFKLAGQDVSLLDKGAHTGEVGAFQLKDFCQYCIVGHSERKETIDVTIKKRDLCLKYEITPLVCFANINEAQKVFASGSFLVWEDPTNISINGKYRAKPIAEIQSGVDKIRTQIGTDVILIYGGSVNRQNITDLANINGLNGILPGNASLDAEHFVYLIEHF